MMHKPAPQLNATDWIVLAAALLLPTAITWLYFIALNGAPAWQQQGAYVVGKAVQFGLPAVWIWLVRRQNDALLARPAGWSLVVGGVFGAFVGVAMIVLYLFALRDLSLFDEAASAVRAKVQSFGAGSPLLTRPGRAQRKREERALAHFLA